MAKWLKNAAGERLQAGLLVGSDSVTQIQTDTGKQVPVTGNNDFRKQLDRIRFYWERLHITPNYFRQNWRWDLRQYHLLCNMVTDADHNPKTLKAVERLAETLNRPIINHPRHIAQTARDRLPKTLAGIPGIIMPRTVRLKNPTPERLKSRVVAEGLRWPLLVKEPGLHSGRFVGLFKSPEEFAPHLDGARKDYMLTEFANFKSADGLYRKCRFWCIGRKFILRHHVIDTEWNLHGHNRLALMAKRPELRREEEALLEQQLTAFSTSTIETLEAIRERLQLDYFGIDCHVRPNGRVLIFEANATMNYGSKFEGAPEYAYIARILEPMAKAAIGDLAAEKLKTSPERLGLSQPAVAV